LKHGIREQEEKGKNVRYEGYMDLLQKQLMNLQPESCIQILEIKNVIFIPF